MIDYLTWKSKEAKELYSAILKLKGADEVAMFLRDLCTAEEISEMAKRWQAAKMLNQEKSYREIAKKTGLSTTTVTRVAQWLKSGKGGYKLALSKK
jgi:TrpR-related protein YerC/YecD